jgi:hypothetical protein
MIIPHFKNIIKSIITVEFPSNGIFRLDIYYLNNELTSINYFVPLYEVSGTTISRVISPSQVLFRGREYINI